MFLTLEDYVKPTLPSDSSNSCYQSVASYLSSNSIRPLFICGDSLEVLSSIPSDSIDCCITSPPYWSKREYDAGGIGLEDDYNDYIEAILGITSEIYRVLKPSGSFWLNIGDTYKNKSLMNIPWRVATAMTDRQSWILRNTIIWNKVKGNPDNSNDKLRNMYEPIFHFVKSKQYYYDIDAVRNPPAKTIDRNGTTVSATGVSGIKYRKQIEESQFLSDDEKKDANIALDQIIQDMNDGLLSDFRMVIRGQQRTTHSDSEKVSGRAKELHTKGFYFLKYNPKGTKPGDIWNIIPVDTQKRSKQHFASYPLELCEMPLKTTCPKGGVVLDPFCGTGTTMIAAMRHGVKSIGIDISKDYIQLSEERVSNE